jgi:feruloyl esterase
MKTSRKLSDTSVFLFACAMLFPTQARAARCEDLTKLNLPSVAITSSTSVPAGQFTPPGSSTALETPEFCRVVAVAKPTSDSVINFEVWIPPAAQWNHNFLGRGKVAIWAPSAMEP